MSHRTAVTPPSKRRALPTALAFALLGSFGAISWAGCGGASVASACRTLCDCYECSDEEYDACVDSGERERERKVEAGCGGEFDAFLDCQADKFECDDGSPRRLVGCESEEAALQRCGGDICDEAIAKLNECGITAERGEGECEEAARCISACLLDATCDEITTGSDRYHACVQSCMD